MDEFKFWKPTGGYNSWKCDDLEAKYKNKLQTKQYALAQWNSQQQNEQCLTTHNDKDSERYGRAWSGSGNGKYGDDSDKDLLIMVGVRRSGRDKQFQSNAL